MSVDIQVSDDQIERLPPQSVEAEQAVLGALLVMGDAITRVLDILHPEYFYRKIHQVIYAVMLDLFERNEPIDIVTVSQELKDQGKLETVGGRQFLADLAMSVATTANLEYYAHLVHDKAMLRMLIKAGTEIVTTSYEESDADAAIDKAERLIFSLAENRDMKQLVPIGDIVGDSFAKIEERYTNRDQLAGVPSGFYDLDAMTSGFQGSDLIILAARPSMGKCLSFDSEIVLSDGSIATIEDICKSKSGKLLTLSSDLKLQQTEASDFIDDGIKPVFKVTTKLGRSVETTLSHPFLTIGGWKKLKDLVTGEKIAVPRKIDVFGTKTIRDCEVKLLAYLIGDGSISQSKIGFTNTNPKIQSDFSEAVSQFGGVTLRREESTTRALSVYIRSDREAIAINRNEFSKRLKQRLVASARPARQIASAIGVSPASINHWTDGNCVPSEYSFSKLVEVLGIEPTDLIPEGRVSASRASRNSVSLWLDELGLTGKDAHTKFIPDIVFTLKREQVALFLNRLFATDGWASKLASGQSQLGYATVSETLARQVQHLLLRFGIIAKLKKRSVKYKDGHRSCWQLDITDRNSIETFIDNVGIFGKETAVAEVRTALEKRKRQTNCDLVPIEVWTQLKALKGAESWQSLANRSGLTNSSNLHVDKRSMPPAKLLQFANALNNDSLKALANSDVYWDEIVSIEPMGKKQVYDLTIPDTHNFVANDICVHNTALALNIAQYVALEKNLPVAIFSLEMSKEQLVQRMLCSEAGIDATRLRTGNLQNNDWTRLSMAMGRLGEAPMYIDDSAVVTALEIRAKARRLKAEQKDLGMIIIDYIQLMQGRKATDNRVQEVSEISRSLKTLARELAVPVIALSQLSRAVEARQNKRPMLSDLRESGSIEQDADIVMFIYRDEYYNQESDKRGEAEVIIAKQRNGPTGTVDLLYQSTITRFLNKVHNSGYTEV